jgi:hypothetical protein
MQSVRRTGNVSLLDPFFGEPLGEDVSHWLRREGYGEGKFGVVPRHGRNVLIIWQLT